MREVEELDPNAYTIKVHKQVSDYFSMLQKKIKEAEKLILNQIKNSENLRGLKEIYDQLHQKVNSREVESLEEEKKIID